jgi:Macrocin-O-methyltransferase (TylF)
VNSTEPGRTHVYRTETEQDVAKRLGEIFERCTDPLEIRLENFPKYVRRQHLKRFLALYELFKLALPIKGSVVECGVFRGFGLMSWAKLSAILEPENLTRRIYGFDTFAGFPELVAQDKSSFTRNARGDLNSESYEELRGLIEQHDRDRFLGHIPKVELIKGDLTQTASAFVAAHPHLVVSLLFLDCDLYEPTKAALQAFMPRMPKGGIIAFDELDNPIWPGETLAALEAVGLRNLRLRRLEWDPYVAYAEIE